MPAHNYYAQGQWNVECEICGLVFKSGQIQKNWDESYRCPSCSETRHPQDFVRGVIDDPSVPFSRRWNPNITDLIWITSAGELVPWNESLGVTIDWLVTLTP